MALGCGCWDDVARQFTLPRYAAMWRHWSRQPPVALMVAAWLGIGPVEAGDLGQLLRIYGPERGEGR